MEARINWAAGRAAVRRAAFLAAVLLVGTGAQSRSKNFIIETPDANFSHQVAQAAEKYRHDLAVEWLGEAMPNWAQPCVMTVQVGPHLGAGGATTFVFDHGEVFGWRMSIQGTPERVLDSVLPHEITHMIFASQFRQPLPRWADEGGATSVEHASEKSKHCQMLNQFLRTGRGIAFSQMFAMTEYPRDIMPLYAEGYSLAEFLIQSGGRRKYVEFIDDGLKSNDWPAAVRRHYGAKDLAALQNTWLAWVSQGSPPLATRDAQPPAAAGGMLAANQPRPRPDPNLIYRVPEGQSPATPLARLVPVHLPASPASPTLRAGEEKAARAATAMNWTDPRRASSSPTAVASAVALQVKSAVAATSGWHAAGAPAAAAIALPSPPSADPLRTQVTHPQSLEQPRQIVLE